MSDGSQFALLATRRFGPFFATQCLGALNDNILRNGLVMLVAFESLPGLGERDDVFANIVADNLARGRRESAAEADGSPGA